MMPPDIARRLGPLFKGLRNSDPWVRSQAVESLKRYEFKDYVTPGLLEVLSDEAVNIRIGAASVLAFFDHPAALEALTKELGNTTKNVHTIRIQAARLLEPFGRAAVPALTEALHDPHGSVRREAARVLAEIESNHAFDEVSNDDTLVKFKEKQGKPLPPIEEKPKDAGPRAGQVLDARIEAERGLRAINDRIVTFREEATRQLQDALNTYLRVQTSATFDDKQNIVDTVNSSLERLGLAISYKGETCNFAATMSGGTTAGRFLIVPKGSKTPLLARVSLADFLPLELTDGPPRREGLKEWRDREQSRRSTGRSHEVE